MSSDAEEADASWISRAVYHWMTPMIAKGYRKPLQYDDLCHLAPNLLAAPVTDTFQRYWNEEKTRAQPNLLRALWRAFGAEFAIAGVYRGIADQVSTS